MAGDPHICSIRLRSSRAEDGRGGRQPRILQPSQGRLHSIRTPLT
jgi:hypothetical protein